MANPVTKAGKGLLDLLFLHNTDPYKLKRIQEMEGMANPSMAVTQKDIPFEGFGDITLVGKPSRFDPAKKGNPIFTGDAYTIRDPQPVRQAKKGAWEQLDKDYEGLVDPRDMGGVRSVLEQMERKGNMSASYLDEVERFLQGYKGMTKYAKDKGIAWEPDKYGQMSYSTREKIIAQDPEGWDAWVDSMMNRYLEPDKYFKDGKKLVPYTAENISKWKNKYAGVGQEDTMTYGTGNIFASDTKKLGSLDEIRANRDILQHPDKVRETKNWIDSQMDDLSESLRGSYEWDSNGFEYYNDVRKFYADTRKMSIDKAAKKHGFKNIPDNVREHLNWMNQESGTQFPAAYFESKPERVVQFDDFGGAIVPDDAPKGIVDFLTNQGIRVEKYSKADEASRTAARSKFQDMMFQYGIPAATVGLGSGALGMLSPEEQLFAAPIQPQEPQPSMMDSLVTGAKRGFYKANSPEGFALGLMDALGAPAAGDIRDKLAQSKYQDDEEKNQLLRLLGEIAGGSASMSPF